MSRPGPPIDWQSLLGSDAPSGPTADSSRRIRWLVVCFALSLGVIFARAVALEWSEGAKVRATAAMPVEIKVAIPPPRGEIVDRHGKPLAVTDEAVALEMHYRFLEDPPNPAWFRSEAKRRLDPADRKDKATVDAAVARLLVVRADLHRRLALACGQTPDAWLARCAKIDRSVARIAASVNVRHAANMDSSKAKATVERIVVAEELDFHAVISDVPPALVAEINAHPDDFPFVRTTATLCRRYPQGDAAAHLLGYVARDDSKRNSSTNAANASNERGEPNSILVGKTGLERQFNDSLVGEAGEEVRQRQRGGKLLDRRVITPALPGRRITLTIDSRLQIAAEKALDAALIAAKEVESETSNSTKPAPIDPPGGAIIALDCRTGEILACAAAPRFDPNSFAMSDSDAIARLLADPGRPLFDRATGMAIPPGSVMKTITAVALVESGTVRPDERFFCQGYLARPERRRCAIYRHFGVGHDEIDLAEALAVSCNVYFYQHATKLGATPIVDWATRFGLGAKTGCELTSESAGKFPSADQTTDDDVQALAVGQSLLATPLQIARAIAAIANDGILVDPHFILDNAHDGADRPSNIVRGEPIVGVHSSTVAAVRRGMELAVRDPRGTAHRELGRRGWSVAAKTGTAETGIVGRDHAWIAGYAPAESPRVAFVVALEHGGNGGASCGPIAARLLSRLQELGYLDVARLADARARSN